MKSASLRHPHYGHATTMPALVASLLFIPTVMVQAIPEDHGINEFQRDAQAENHAQPYFDADPDYSTPVLRGSSTSRRILGDLFSGGGSPGASSSSGGGGGGGGGGGAASGGGTSFGTVGGSPISTSNPLAFASDGSSGPDSLSNRADSRPVMGGESGNTSLDQAVQNGGYDIRSTFPVGQLLQTEDIAQLVAANLTAVAAVPESLPLVACLVPLLMAAFAHRRMRRNLSPVMGSKDR